MVTQNTACFIQKLDRVVEEMEGWGGVIASEIIG